MARRAALAGLSLGFAGTVVTGFLGGAIASIVGGLMGSNVGRIASTPPPPWPDRSTITPRPS